MSEQAEKFLAQWQFEHVKLVARSDREYEAGRLALRCLEDAARAKISSLDLEAAAEGDLIGSMLQALDDAASIFSRRVPGSFSRVGQVLLRAPH